MKHRILHTALFSTATLALLAACSSTPEKIIDYGRPIGSNASLEVPPDLVSPERNDRYTMPDQGTLSTYLERQKRGDGNKVSVLPQPAPDSKLHIERAGTQRWLAAPGTPESIWPQLRNFFLDKGLTLVIDKPEVGIMETDWAENHPVIRGDGLRSILSAVIGTVYSTGLRDKYRARVERSKTPGMVDVFLSHRGMEEVYTEGHRDSRWQPRPPGHDLEAEMLRLLMVSLGADAEAAKMALQNLQSESDHVTLTDEADELVLKVRDNHDRVWNQVGLALDRIGLVVEDRDRAKETYFVRYVVSDDVNNANGQNSWLGRMFNRSKDPITGVFQIIVQAEDAVTVISVRNQDGEEDRSESARQILSLLLTELK